MSTTVSYKGNTIATIDNQTKTLLTAGTWVEGNITITDTSSGTAAISVVDTTDSHGGTVRTITGLDISDTTAVASDVAQDKYFYTADGTKTQGSNTGGSSATLITKSITANGTYSASSDNADGYSSVTVNVSGSGTPSATQHTIYFEFTDETDTTITAYYDSTFISDAITATEPTTYGNKTVTLAQLDSVTWYEYDPTEQWETLYDGNVNWVPSEGSYPYCWISELSNTPITVGSVYRVTYNNVEYRCTAKADSIGGRTYNIFGNPRWADEGGLDDGSDVPFVFVDYTQYGAWSGGLNVPNVQSTYYFKIEHLVTS